MARLRFATVWLGGCSGCHMSFLDMDEWLIELAQHVEIVFCPLVDIKEYPDNVDLALVDIHLSDGPTGIDLGRELGQDMGVTVLFMTANPGMLREGVAGTIGVLSKPSDERAVQTAVDYALRRRQGRPVEYAPPELRLFA